MFTGNVMHKLDTKGRVAIPASWRDAQDTTLRILEATNDGYPILKCYTMKSYAEMVLDIKSNAKALGFTPVQINKYLGEIFSRCFDAEVSNQGKLLIPKAQREYIKITENATIVGRGSYFEIWEPGNYEATRTPETMAGMELDKVFGILA